MAENIANQIARQLYAMAQRANGKQPDLHESVINGKYQRTFTDEYSFAKKSRAGFRKVSDEQKKEWEAAASRK